MEVRLPNNGTYAEGDDISCSGFGGAWRAIGVSTMKTGEISVDVTVHCQVASWFDDHSFVDHPVEIANNTLDSGGVTPLGIVRESGDLAHGKGDVGTCVRRQIKQHADDRAIAPRLLYRWAIWVDTKCNLARWRPFSIAVVVHSSSFLDLLDEALLSECKSAFFQIALKLLDAKKASKVPSFVKVNPFSVKVSKNLSKSAWLEYAIPTSST